MFEKNSIHELLSPPQGKFGWPWQSPTDIINDRLIVNDALPKISIITPSYNQSNFIEETIRSVFLQNYPNLEYILVDGGSNSKTLSIINEYTSRFTWWTSEKDHGQAEAINKGLKKSTGDIVAWINSDDRYLPEAFSLVANFFINNPEIDMVYGDAEIIDKYGKFIMHRKELEFDLTMGRLVGFGILITQPAVFWRRKVIASIGYLDEKLYYTLDSDYWSRIADHHRIVHIPKVLAQYRYHDEAKTIRAEKEKNSLASEEISTELKTSYKKLFISKYLPYTFAKFIRLYRIKRIFLRLFRGHYFTGYQNPWLFPYHITKK